MCEYLINHNHIVFGMDINNSYLIDDDNFEFIHFDFKSAEKMLKNKSIDIIYHFAWCGVSSIDKNNPEKQLANISLTYGVLKLAKEIGAKKIIIPGSISEFSRCKKAITGLEKDSPSDLYAATKVSIRKIAFQFCKIHEIGLNWALITSVYGGDRIDGNLLTYTINNLLDNRQVLTTRLEQLWDYIYIDDLIECLYLIGLRGKKNAIYPIGSGRIEQLSFYVGYIADYLAKRDLLKIGALPYKNKYIDNSIVNTLKIQRLGFSCKKTFEENIIDVISFIKKTRNNE